MDKEIIFQKIREILKKYSSSFTVTQDTNTDYELYTQKPVEIQGRKFPKLYFSAVRIQKNFVGFYYMPIYAEPKLLEIIKPELLKCLKGKSCFHINKDDPILFSQIDEALKIGKTAYIERGWL